MALAMIKLPINKKMMGSANGVKTTFAGATPKRTQSTAPRSAVTGMGMASDIQSVMTSPSIAASICPSSDKEGVGIR